jgi:hypothetical protein
MIYLFTIFMTFVSATECQPIESAKTTNAKFTYWGFHVYDIVYETQKKFPEAPYRLELIYRKNIKADAIVKSSKEEMLKVGGPESKVNEWGEEIKKIFPNVKPGDSLLGYVDNKKRSIFCQDNKVLGTIEDPQFADYFFGIWLSEKSSRTDIRNKLVGNK